MRFFLMAFLPAFIFSGCRTENDIPAVSKFELSNYMGRWYECARLPNWFEKDMTNVSAEYSLMDDGSVKVVNSGYKNGKLKTITGKAKYAGKNSSGELKVSFFRPFYSPYRIIKLAPDYRYSVVCSGGRKYLWVLARSEKIAPEDWQEIMDFLHENNFETGKLIRQ